MRINEYQQSSRSTAVYKGKGTFGGVVYNSLKLAGEAGEIADKIGKKFGKGDETVSESELADLNKELGDVFWHLCNLATDLGLSMGDVARANEQKLTDRQERGVLVGHGDNR